MMTIVSIASFSYNDSVKTFFVSVFHVEARADSDGLSSLYQANSFNSFEIGDVTTTKVDPGLVSFKISNNADTALVESGTKNAEIMQFEFKSPEEVFELKSLDLKIYGVDSFAVERATLVVADEVIAFGKRSDDYFKFNSIDYKIPPGNRGIVSVKVDLTDELKISDRFRLDIEKPEDIEIQLDGEDFIIDEHYPIKGEYLSIAKPRPWGVDWSK